MALKLSGRCYYEVLIMGEGGGGGGRKKRKKEPKGKKGEGWIPVLAVVDKEGNVVATYKDLQSGQTRL